MTIADGFISTGLAAIALLFAIAISGISLRTFRRERTATHRNAFFGFFFLTSGLFIEEALLWLTGLPLQDVHSLESLLFVLGFGFLYLSLR